MSTAFCKACGKPIIWIRTTAGRMMPVDQKPVEYIPIQGDIWKFPALCLIKHTVIPAGSRIAQFRLIEHQPKLHFEEAVLLAGSDRGGFGSTGR